MGPVTRRAGERPKTNYGLPHMQMDQQPSDRGLRDQLAAQAFALPDVTEASSGISVPGARALVLSETAAKGPPTAFMVGREFAHLHPEPDVSLHMSLPELLAREAVAAGWAEFHPLVATGRAPATMVMVFAPRNAEELEVVWELLTASHRFARGEA